MPKLKKKTTQQNTGSRILLGSKNIQLSIHFPALAELEKKIVGTIKRWKIFATALIVNLSKYSFRL